jgi:hypothetical protein
MSTGTRTQKREILKRTGEKRCREEQVLVPDRHSCIEMGRELKRYTRHCEVVGGTRDR